MTNLLSLNTTKTNGTEHSDSSMIVSSQDAVVNSLTVSLRELTEKEEGLVGDINLIRYKKGEKISQLQQILGDKDTWKEWICYEMFATTSLEISNEAAKQLNSTESKLNSYRNFYYAVSRILSIQSIESQNLISIEDFMKDDNLSQISDGVWRELVNDFWGSLPPQYTLGVVEAAKKGKKITPKKIKSLQLAVNSVIENSRKLQTPPGITEAKILIDELVDRESEPLKDSSRQKNQAEDPGSKINSKVSISKGKLAKPVEEMTSEEVATLLNKQEEMITKLKNKIVDLEYERDVALKDLEDALESLKEAEKKIQVLTKAQDVVIEEIDEVATTEEEEDEDQYEILSSDEIQEYIKEIEENPTLERLKEIRDELSLDEEIPDKTSKAIKTKLLTILGSKVEA